MWRRRDFMLASVSAGVFASSGTSRAAPDKESIHEFLEVAVGTGWNVAGRVAVVIDAHGISTAVIGSSDVPGVSMNRDTVFEIGSIDKVLNALMLADMAARGEVSFDDPVAKYLPSSVKLHVRGRPITLNDLATYRSGLPNMPGNLPPQWWTLPNPYADYTQDKLYAFLSSYVPEDEPGSHYRYANLGFALLGHVLARRAGKSYSQLLVERICNPLGLRHTRVSPTADMQRHMAQGHNPDSLKPVPSWGSPSLPEMAGVRSTATDLTVILNASMGLGRTPLNESLSRMLKTRQSTTVKGTDVGLGWFISSNGSEEIVWKSGLTGGFSSFIGFSTQTRCGAILLSNGGYTAGAGMKLINSDFDPGDLDSIMR